MTARKIAVFGSAFNPPHRGHMDVVQQALQVFDDVILVPSFKHAFGKDMALFELRLQLTRDLVALDFGASTDQQNRVHVLDIERIIALQKNLDEPVYTYDVMLALERLYPENKLTFIIGPDNAAPSMWSTFYKHDIIDERWGHWAAEERLHIRSSRIRQQLKNNEKPEEYTCPAIIWQRYLAASAT